MTALPDLTIPAHLLPADGRFGSGPSRVRAAQLGALVASNPRVLGTSHRQAPVKDVVRRVRTGLASLLSLPDGYEIVLGNGGSTAFWDAAVFSLIRDRSCHVSIGEFSAKFAKESADAPHLAEPAIVAVEPGTAVSATADDARDCDAVAWPHNETSTGVMLSISRPDGLDSDQLCLVDGTSAAGGVDVDLAGIDAYYFAPQKALGSEGGLWLAALSPAAVERAEGIEASGRWVPSFLSVATAVENSRKDQTLNTPAIATLVLLVDQIEWILAQGGLAWADARTRASTRLISDWVGSRPEASFFVADPAHRSQVVSTVDLDESIDASVVVAALRSNGIVDVEPYRKLGRNQVRIGAFPSVPESDVEALLASLSYVLDNA